MAPVDKQFSSGNEKFITETSGRVVRPVILCISGNESGALTVTSTCLHFLLIEKRLIIYRVAMEINTQTMVKNFYY